MTSQFKTHANGMGRGAGERPNGVGISFVLLDPTSVTQGPRSAPPEK